MDVSSPNTASSSELKDPQDKNADKGILKIYFGASVGVGKTFAMLEAAAVLSRNGIDVVVGVVETHGRKETEALLIGMDVIPARIVEHKTTKISEFDLDAALLRRPQIILIDELAHNNAPGSRHAKRWQDVMELLDAGIAARNRGQSQQTGSDC